MIMLDPRIKYICLIDVLTHIKRVLINYGLMFTA